MSVNVSGADISGLELDDAKTSVKDENVASVGIGVLGSWYTVLDGEDELIEGLARAVKDDKATRWEKQYKSCAFMEEH